MGDRPGARETFAHAVDLYRDSGILRPFAAFSRADLEELAERSGAAEPGRADPLAQLAADRPSYPDQVALVRLTNRETALVRELERTASRQEIAAALFVSVNTVKSQIQGLYQKLGTSTREETLLKVRQLGLWP
jgi:LuxR family maltose regulon positive regulatory protein